MNATQRAYLVHVVLPVYGGVLAACALLALAAWRLAPAPWAGIGAGFGLAVALVALLLLAIGVRR